VNRRSRLLSISVCPHASPSLPNDLQRFGRSVAEIDDVRTVFRIRRGQPGHLVDGAAHPRDPDGTPRRAGPHRESVLLVFGAAVALALEQDSPGGVQGGGVGGHRGRHHRHGEGGQRRELLRRTEELHGGHEEPSGQVQRFEVRRTQWQG
jgi:hypothetical protein